MKRSEKQKTFSDVSYLKQTRNKFYKMSESIYQDASIEQSVIEFIYLKRFRSPTNNNFHKTLYRITKSKPSFKNYLPDVKFKRLEFTDVLQNSNPKLVEFQKYFTAILKSENLLDQKDLIPANRQQILDLKDWMIMMLSSVRDQLDQMASKDIVDKLQVIYATTLKEIINQVSVECSDRGELLQSVWDFYIELIEYMISIYQQQNKLNESHFQDQITRMQANNQLQTEVFSQRIADLETRLQDRKIELTQRDEASDQAKMRILTLASELRSYIQQNDTLRKEIDGLFIQLMFYKSQDEQKQHQKENLKVKMQEGKSIVSHLLNFNNEINQEAQFIRKKKKRNTVFDQLEKLRLEEDDLIAELRSRKVIEHSLEYVDQETQTNDLAQQPSIEIEETDTILQETISKQTIRESIQKDMTLKDTIAKDTFTKDTIQKDINLNTNPITDEQSLVGQLQKQNQELQQRINEITLIAQKQKVQIMEKEDDLHSVNRKMRASIQEFMTIVQEKSQRISILQTNQEKITSKIKTIKSKYKINLNIEEDDQELEDALDDQPEINQEIEYFQELLQETQETKHKGRQYDLELERGNFNMITETPSIVLQEFNNDFQLKQQDHVNENQFEVQNNNQQGLSVNAQLEKIERNFAEDQFKIQNNNQQGQQVNFQLEKVEVQKPTIRIELEKQKPGQQIKQSSFKNKRQQQIQQHQPSAQMNTPSKNTQRSPQLLDVDSSDGSRRQSTKNLRNNKKHATSRYNSRSPVLTPRQSQPHSMVLDQQSEKSENNLPDDITSRQQLQSKAKTTNAPKNQKLQIKRQDSNKSDVSKSFQPRTERIKQSKQQKNDSFSSDSDSEDVLDKDDKKYLRQREVKGKSPDVKAPKRFKRIYSQNTDAANNLFQETMKKNKSKVKLSLLQVCKVVHQIFSDIAKQQEGYKIPFHVSIYDYFKNKYGFKQVAEKKIKQVYLFINQNVNTNVKCQLLCRLCSNDMDEIGQKLFTESFNFFVHKYDFNLVKPDSLLTYDAVSEFLVERSSLWLNQTEIQQMQQLFRQQQQQGDKNRVFINYDLLVQTILQIYVDKKQEQQKILNYLFMAADLDGNNLIEYSEFKTLYRAIHPEKTIDQIVLGQFMIFADYQDENGDKMITLPRFAEMSLELSIFQKELILRYSEGSSNLSQFWNNNKDLIKYRYLKAKKYQKVKFTINEIEQQITNKQPDRQRVLWISYKFLIQESMRQILKYETKQLLNYLLPIEVLLIKDQFEQFEQLD